MPSFSVTGLVEWTKAVFVPFGPLGLFLVAFMESSFFPIPPDLVLIPLALAVPELALFYALVATMGSVSGSVLGYYIGKKGGKPVLKKFASEEKMNKLTSYFDRYGSFAIAIAGFSFIPYKVFTIASGAFRFSLTKMLAVSLLARGTRFLLEATIIMLYGELILELMTDYFDVFTIVIVLAAVLFYFAYKKLRK
jgi:undecaprenyl-diphosphatase